MLVMTIKFNNFTKIPNHNKISDCLEKLLPNAEIIIGQNLIDLDNQRFNRYVY